MSKLFLFDAYAIIFRSYYAFINRPTINSKGFNTSAVLGFCNTLREIIDKEQPTHLGVAFDHGKTFRHEASRPTRRSATKRPRTSSSPCLSSRKSCTPCTSPCSRPTASRPTT